MLIRARSGTTYGNCSCSYVTYFQRDEVKRADARGNSRTGIATIQLKFRSQLKESWFNKSYCTFAISISDSFLISVFSRLVISAYAVSIAVSTFTPVSIAFLRITNPSLECSAPCAGISITRSILCPRIRSRRFGDSCSILRTGVAFTPASFSARAVPLVAKICIRSSQIFFRSLLHLHGLRHGLSSSCFYAAEA